MRACVQETIFDACGKPAVEAALNGFNATIFSYGQTGSGKTFTMMGPKGSISASDNERGLVSRVLESCFAEAKQSGCECSPIC